MLYSGKVFRTGFVILGILVMLNSSAWVAAADSAGNQVAVSIPEVCRFRVANLREFAASAAVNQSGTVTEVTVTVLSNSKRTWRLTASPDSPAVEWSLDRQTWQPLRGNDILLRGEKSFWNSYHFYYRIRGTEPETTNLPQIEYQIYFES